jgi:hypothetical protein
MLKNKMKGYIMPHEATSTAQAPSISNNNITVSQIVAVNA